MGLDPQAAESLAQRAGTPRPHEVSPAEARALQAAAPRVAGPEVARVEDRLVPGPHGDVPVRVYVPAGGGAVEGELAAGGGAVLPVTMWFHGGGWVVGNIETNDATCRALANASGSIVASVGYRLSPEHPFPIPLDDCYAATVWAQENAGELGGDGSRLAVAGASAGGNLAAAVALLARDRGGPRLAHQSLIYPVTSRDFGRASYRENGAGYGLDLETMAYFWDCYARGDDAGSGYAVPSVAGDLSGLPPAYVLTAEFDPLRDEGEEYGELLRSAGVPARVTRYEGMIHGFFNAGAPFDQTWTAIAEAGSELRKAFEAG